jgi:hypothetical protein
MADQDLLNRGDRGTVEAFQKVVEQGKALYLLQRMVAQADSGRRRHRRF